MCTVLATWPRGKMKLTRQENVSVLSVSAWAQTAAVWRKNK